MSHTPQRNLQCFSSFYHRDKPKTLQYHQRGLLLYVTGDSKFLTRAFVGARSGISGRPLRRRFLVFLAYPGVGSFLLGVLVGRRSVQQDSYQAVAQIQHWKVSNSCPTTGACDNRCSQPPRQRPGLEILVYKRAIVETFSGFRDIFQYDSTPLGPSRCCSIVLGSIASFMVGRQLALAERRVGCVAAGGVVVDC
jgi:hypothetical protein